QYESIITHHVDNLPYLNCLLLEKTYIYLRDICISNNQLDLAIEFASKTNPANPDNQCNAANLYRKKGKEELTNKNYAQAKQWHQCAIKLFKQMPSNDKYIQKRYEATLAQYEDNLSILA